MTNVKTFTSALLTFALIGSANPAFADRGERGGRGHVEKPHVDKPHTEKPHTEKPESHVEKPHSGKRR
jgi:hypothetical protein